MRKYLIFILLLSSILYSCNEQQGKKPTPKLALSQEVEPHYIDASTDSEIALATGTKISIPASVFIDGEGNPYDGKVAIEFEEFHDAADIILSNITMKYDSAGNRMDFQTAGMFSIKAFSVAENTADILSVFANDSKPQPLAIAPGKNISINLASYADDDGYNFYELNSNANNWQYLQTVQKVVNTEKTSLLDSIAPVPSTDPIEPAEPLENLPVIQLSFSKSKFPGLKNFKDLMWQYVGEDKKNDPSLPHNQWIFDKKWEDMDLQRKEENVYTLVLKENGQTTSFDIRPVLFGSDLVKAKKRFDNEMIKYDEAIKNRQEREEQMKSVANFRHLLRIARFGTYNVDKIYGDPNSLFVKANFSIKGKPEIDLENLTFFHITGEGRVVVNYNGGDIDKFNFSNKDKNSLMAILPNNGIALLDYQEFKKLTNSIDEIKRIDFALNPLESINSASELKSILKDM